MSVSLGLSSYLPILPPNLSAHFACQAWPSIVLGLCVARASTGIAGVGRGT